MSFLKAGRPVRGRPRGSGVLKKPEQKSTIPAKLTPELWAFLTAQKGGNESLSETIFRLIRQSSHKYITERKKVDALEERLERYEQTIFNKEPNK